MSDVAPDSAWAYESDCFQPVASSRRSIKLCSNIIIRLHVTDCGAKRDLPQRD